MKPSMEVTVSFGLTAASFSRLEALAEKRGKTVDEMVKQLTLIALGEMCS